MASPYQYPWVDFNSTATTGIDSTPTLIFGAAANSVIDSIFVCNTSDQDIFIDIKLIMERNLVSSNPYRTYHFSLPRYGNAELLTPNTDKTQTVLTLVAGDTMFANSDLSGNTFDCIVSFRGLLETA